MTKQIINRSDNYYKVGIGEKQPGTGGSVGISGSLKATNIIEVIHHYVTSPRVSKFPQGPCRSSLQIIYLAGAEWNHTTESHVFPVPSPW